MSAPLRLVHMPPTEADHLRRQRRQAWWLLVCRLASGETQQSAAGAAGLTAASSYGDFERGVTPPSLRQLTNLAGLFGVPIAFLADPPETDEERWEKLTGRTSERAAVEVAPERRRRATG